MKSRIACVLLASSFVLPSFAVTASLQAQEPASAFPSRNIVVVVPYTAGGPPDVIVRALSPVASTVLGKPIVIENQAGGGTTLASAAVARAAPDGYTLLAVEPTHAIIPNTMPNLKYDPLKDFKAVINTANAPLTAVINPSLPVRNLKELVAFSKSKPDALTVGHSGIATPPYLFSRAVVDGAGAEALFVPYRGVALAVADVVAGHIQMMSSSPSTTVALTLDGRVRMLGLSGDERLKALPDVPTFKEQGLTLRGFDQGSWFGLLAPAGTPDAIIAKLNHAFNQAVKDAGASAVLAKVDIKTRGGTPEAFGKLIAEQVALWRETFANSATLKKDAEAKVEPK